MSLMLSCLQGAVVRPMMAVLSMLVWRGQGVPACVRAGAPDGAWPLLVLLIGWGGWEASVTLLCGADRLGRGHGGWPIHGFGQGLAWFLWAATCWTMSRWAALRSLAGPRHTNIKAGKSILKTTTMEMFTKHGPDRFRIGLSHNLLLLLASLLGLVWLALFCIKL